MSDIFTLLEGDAADTLKTLPSESIDLVVTSPPYGELRKTYCHNYNFEGIADELGRVLKPGGVICWNEADEVIDGGESLLSFQHALYFANMRVGGGKAKMRLHQTLIYGKTNSTHPPSGRYCNYSEYVFVISKGTPKTFNPIIDKKNKYAGLTCFGKNTVHDENGSEKERPKNIVKEFGMRGNIWIGNTRGQEEVCTKLPRTGLMPKWLAKDLIISFSNSGDVVLDPFAGSGTTGREAIENGRKFIACEKDPTAFDLIRQTCTTTIGFNL